MYDLAKIDLHMHSTVSDGTDTPAELLQRVKQAGLELFALTDHDDVAGCAEIEARLAETDEAGSAPRGMDRPYPHFITGVEFSCKDPQGKYHILGYGMDCHAPAMKAAMEEARALRLEKLKGRLDFLEREFGYAFSQEEVAWLWSLPNPGKPHIADLMVRHGWAADRGEAIRRYLNKRKAGEDYMVPESAIQAILRAGGIPILAHPTRGDGSQSLGGAEMEQRLVRLLDMGILGVEAYYSDFSRAEQDEMLDLADRYDLYVSAGSDYHGPGKRSALGDTPLERARRTPGMTEPAPGLLRFLADITER